MKRYIDQSISLYIFSFFFFSFIYTNFHQLRIKTLNFQSKIHTIKSSLVINRQTKCFADRLTIRHGQGIKVHGHLNSSRLCPLILLLLDQSENPSNGRTLSGKYWKTY